MNVQCVNCEKTFYAKPYDVNVRGKKFCSRVCYSIKAHTIVNTGRFSLGHKRQGFSEKNSNWKGEGVGYTALHQWVKARLHKTLLCQKCDINESMDLANKSNKYLRDLSDWWWLCRSCHMKLDGRMKVFLSNRKNAKR